MRGRPKKEKIAKGIVDKVDYQYPQIAHCYMNLNKAIEELNSILNDIEVQYEHWMPDYTTEDKVYKMSNKMVFDNIKWTINDIHRQLSAYLERILKHTDDMKWSDHVKEEKK